jgi:hypothetical protein
MLFSTFLFETMAEFETPAGNMQLKLGLSTLQTRGYSQAAIL